MGAGISGRRSSRARDGAGALMACRRRPQARQHQPSHCGRASRGIAAASDVGRPSAVDGEGYIPSSALEPPPWAAAIVADAAAVLVTAPARLWRAAAGRNHDNISRRTAVAPAAAIAAASDVGRPGAVDGEGYIPSSALEPPPWATETVAVAAAVLAAAPARSTRAAASRKLDNTSRRTAVALAEISQQPLTSAGRAPWMARVTSRPQRWSRRRGRRQ